MMWIKVRNTADQSENKKRAGANRTTKEKQNKRKKNNRRKEKRKIRTKERKWPLGRWKEKKK